MNDSNLSPRQRRLAAASATAAVAARTSAEARTGHPPTAGDRYLLPATSGLPIEWVLLERHSDPPAFRAVLADTHPLTESTDVAVLAGALRLRCRARVWLAEDALDPALRVGAIDRITLEKARRKIHELDHDPDPAPMVDAEAPLEHQDWQREVIAPALAALESPTLSLLAAARPSSSQRRGSVFLAAASILLVLGLAGWAGWQSQQIDRLDAERREAQRSLESERARLAEVLRSAEEDSQRRLAGLVQKERARVAELQQQLSEVEKKPVGFPEALLNVPVAILNPAELLRGEEPQEVLLNAAAPYLTLGLDLGPEAEYPSYRVVLRREGSSKTLWQSDRLQSKDHRLQFSLGQSFFSAGTYRIDVFGLRGGRAEPLGDYELTIERTP